MKSHNQQSETQNMNLFELATKVEDIAHSASYLAAELTLIANSMVPESQESKAIMGIVEYASDLSKDVGKVSAQLYDAVRSK